MGSKIRFEDVRFRANIREHDKSVFVGYADATLVVPGVLDQGEDLKIRIRGIEVKVLSSGPRIDFKSIRGENGKWYPTLFPQSATSRDDLTIALLSDPVIDAVVSRVESEFFERSDCAASNSDEKDEIPF